MQFLQALHQAKDIDPQTLEVPLSMSTKLPPAHHQACTVPHLSSALAPHLLQHRACPKHLQTSRLRTSHLHLVSDSLCT